MRYCRRGWRDTWLTGLTSKRAMCGELGLRDADDQTIFQHARQTSSIVVIKDSDFVELV